MKIILRTGNEKVKMPDFMIKILENIDRFLSDRNIPAWLVGGTVRDLLLGRDLTDVDLAVKAEREIAEKLAVFLNATVVNFSYPDVVRLVVSEGGFKLNVDVELLKEKDIIEDLGERDFTINAMALPLTGEGLDFNKLIDTEGGRIDLDSRLIRAVRSDVFVKDPIRILRAYRLAQVLDFYLEEKTRKWIYESGGKVAWQEVAGERIWNELGKILDYDHSAEVLKDLEKEGILNRLLGIFSDRLRIDLIEVCEGVWSENKLLKNLYDRVVADKKKNIYPAFKLGLVLYDVKDRDKVGKVCDFLRLARWEKDLVLNIMSSVENIFASEEEELVCWRRFIYKNKDYAPYLLFAALISRIAEEKTKDEMDNYIDYTVRFLEFYIAERENWCKLPRYIDGRRVMKILNIKPSPVVGKILQMIAEEEIKGKITNEEQAEYFVKVLVNKDLQ